MPVPIQPPRKPRRGAAYALVLVAVIAAIFGVVYGVSQLGEGGGFGDLTEQTAGELGQTPSEGTVSSNAAIQQLENFYTNLIVGRNAAAQSWDLLTPAAQAVYGSKDEFVNFWTTNGVTRYAQIQVVGENPDGSVDLSLATLSYGSTTKSMQLRFVMLDGQAKIDSDTK